MNSGIIRLLSALIALACVPSAYAGQKTSAPAASSPAAPAQAPAKADEKVDISDLENKYWAPKDTDFSVVQNRAYTKEKRLSASIQYGMPINDQYSEGSMSSVAANYFFSERYGAQFTYFSASMEDNQAVKDLRNNYSSGVAPDHGKLSGYYGLGFNWVPFYAKMSFIGKKIMYFDMAVTPTLGITKYDKIMEGGNEEDSALTYGFDVTQYFFFSNWFALRLDLTNHWYTQEVVKYKNSGGMLKGDKVGDKKMHDSIFLIGTTFFF